MKIYEMRCNSYKTQVKIEVKEIEVEEKPLAYVGKRRKCIYKCEIGKLLPFQKMYSFTPDTSEFINALIVEEIKTNEVRMQEITNAKKRIAKLEKMKGG